MTMDSIIDECLSNLIGKTIYFVQCNKIIKGTVNEFDDFQLYVGDKYGLLRSENTQFFFSEKELITYLTKNKLDLTK